MSDQARDISEERFLQNFTWLQPDNLDKPVHVVIGDDNLELRHDLRKIVSYYAAKPADYYLLPDKKPPKQEPQCAKDLKRNIYKLRPSDPVVTLPEDLSWSENPFHDANWEFYFHLWEFAPCLIDGYRAAGDEWYIRRLKWLVQDWWRVNFQPAPPSAFAWYEHTVPLRLNVLTSIWEFVRRHGFLDEAFVETVIRFVYWHGRILDEEEALKRHSHNHGLDQAESLFRAAAVFPEIECARTWRQNALPRMRRELEHMMTDEGIQKENSPDYHQHAGASVFSKLDFVEHYTGDVLSPRLRTLENEVLKFSVAIVKPNGFLPELGDTQPAKRLDCKLPSRATLPWNAHYEYVVSAGKRGYPPQQTRFIYPGSGYYIYRDKWDAPGENQATHLVLKCGFLSNAHRHNDDGHIVLFGLNEPWLTDGGMFGYADDPRRDYAVSAAAHNVTVPVGAAANFNMERRFGPDSRWGIIDYDPDDLSSLTCQSHMYEGFVYQRNLAVVAPRKFELEDRLHCVEGSPAGPVYTQFRIPDDKVVRIDLENGKIHAIGRTGQVMEIGFDPAADTRVDVLRGDDATALSCDTEGWRRVKPVTTVRITGEMRQNRYTAAFRIALLDSLGAA